MNDRLRDITLDAVPLVKVGALVAIAVSVVLYFAGLMTKLELVANQSNRNSVAIERVFVRLEQDSARCMEHIDDVEHRVTVIEATHAHEPR